MEKVLVSCAYTYITRKLNEYITLLLPMVKISWLSNETDGHINCLCVKPMEQAKRTIIVAYLLLKYVAIKKYVKNSKANENTFAA